MNFFMHDVGEEEIEMVGEAIRAGHLTTGVMLQKFKDALEERFRFPAVEVCSSGTSALQLVLYALGVGSGDEVITTPYVGVWTANTILMNGATPVFADIDRSTYNLNPAAVMDAITEKTKVVMPVSALGNPYEHEVLRRLLPDRVRIVADDIEALGSKRGSKYVGEDIGEDVSVHGFWVSKQVTTAGGGAIVSEDRALMKKFEGLTRHGHGLVGDMWKQDFGFNAWLCDPMAAMGVVQVKRFDEKQARLLKVRDMLDRHFHRSQVVPRGYFASEFVYVIELPGIDKFTYAQAMAAHRVPTRPYFQNLLDVPHLQQYKTDPCPVTAEVAARTVALPYHWKLTLAEVQSIAQAHAQVVQA